MSAALSYPGLGEQLGKEEFTCENKERNLGGRGETRFN